MLFFYFAAMVKSLISKYFQMKKSFPLILLVLFSSFVLVGYLLASKLMKKEPTSLVTQRLETPVPLEQKNFLVFLVDDLQSKKPELLAIWSVLSSANSNSNLFFIPLFPDSNISTNDQIIPIFKVQKNKTLSANTIRRFSRVFDLKYDGYFIIDNNTYLAFASDAGIDQLGILTKTPATIEEIELIRASTSNYFSTLCDLITTGASTAFFSKIDWGTAIPGQVVSDKSADEILSMIEILNADSPTKTCKVAVP